MNGDMDGATRRYGNVVLGVESALPAVTLPARSRLRRLCSLLLATLRRWA